MNKARFLVVFFALFAVILIAWTRTGASIWYTNALLAFAGLLGPAVHGWVLERAGQGAAWVHGTARVDLSIQFDALAVGQVPLAALLGATPGIAWARRARLLLLGIFLCFAFHAFVVVMFPLLVYYKNAFTDVIGTFLGLVAFVGAPVIIWFALVFRELRQWLPTFRRGQATD
jgi:hypothetical protein